MIVEPIEGYGLSKRERKRTLFSKIGIVGCGKEGSVIATVAARRGMEVVFIEPSAEKIKNSFTRIEKSLDFSIENWGLTLSEKRAIMMRIEGFTTYESLSECDFVVESIRYDDHTGRRDTDLRRDVFIALEKVLSKDAIIASNTSTPVITELATALEFKERCIGVHIMSNTPEAHVMEVVRGLYTNDEVFKKVCQFANIIHYEPIAVAESSGLVSIRLYFSLLNEACRILMEGVSTVEDIDRVMKLGFGNTQGVFMTADQMGIEKIVNLMENLYEEFGDVKYKPSPILLRLYRAQQYGISRRRGFYVYDEEGKILSVSINKIRGVE